MKFSENSLVVDVIKISNSSYNLSVPAGDLLVAAMNGSVLRRHDLSTAAVPNVLYVPLSEAKLSSGTYTFTFASGDKFTASAADAYPAASSVSDKTDSELPAIASTDKGKFLHANESTGALEWAEGGSGGVLVASVVTSGTELFTGTLPNVTGYAWRSTTVSHTESFYVDFTCDLSGTSYNELSAVIGDVKILPTDVSYSDGTVTIKVGSDSGIKSGYTSEAEIAGKTLVLYADAELRLDKTWQEIKDAPVAIFEREVTELGQTTYTTFYKIQIGFETGVFYVVFMELTDNEAVTFVASSASGYPSPLGE